VRLPARACCGRASRGAEDGDRRLRGPRRLDRASGEARPGGRTRRAGPVSQPPADGVRALRGYGREVHRRCRGRRLRSSRRPRGRSGARGARSACDPGRDRRAERVRSGARARGSDRRQHGGGARLARSQARAWRGDGGRRRDEHRRTAAGGCSTGAGAGGGGDLPRDRSGDRVSPGRPRAGEREGEASECLARAGAEGTLWRGRLPDRTRAARRARARGAAPRRSALPRPRGEGNAARDRRWCPRDRKETPPLRALPHRARRPGADRLAAGPIPPLRGGGGVLGARRDRQGPGGHPRVRRCHGGAQQARGSRPRPRRRQGGGMAGAAPASPDRSRRRGGSRAGGAGGGVRGVAALLRGAGRAAGRCPRVRRSPVGGRRPARFRGRAGRSCCRRTAAGRVLN
jgi:hypothetical protein